MDRIIFGDNQFFGINHMSTEKAQALGERFQDLKAITDVIDLAYDAGIRAFMLNTNERAREICDHLRSHASRYADMVMYPSLPYAHKYANLVTEKGIFGAVREVIISDSSAGSIISTLTKGGMSLFERDAIKVMQLLIDAEMKIFRDLNVGAVFLQNIVTDLLLGYRVKEAFIEFADYIKNKYDAEPGFVTLNMPMLVDFLLECGLENPLVCSSINIAGFTMNPDRETYEKFIEEKEFQPVAMSILASGSVSPREAVEYVCRQKNIKGIVFGASTRQHIVETKELIERLS